jgi:hypothetical protein
VYVVPNCVRSGKEGRERVYRLTTRGAWRGGLAGVYMSETNLCWGVLACLCRCPAKQKTESLLVAAGQWCGCVRVLPCASTPPDSKPLITLIHESPAARARCGAYVCVFGGFTNIVGTGPSVVKMSRGFDSPADPGGEIQTRVPTRDTDISLRRLSKDTKERT